MVKRLVCTLSVLREHEDVMSENMSCQRATCVVHPLLPSVGLGDDSALAASALTHRVISLTTKLKKKKDTSLSMLDASVAL